ncbi:MAG: hypothetical protein ACPGVG_07240, partial [Mycobacterium sp.]
MGKLTAFARTDRPHGSARDVGRVGGLALALGVVIYMQIFLNDALESIGQTDTNSQSTQIDP